MLKLRFSLYNYDIQNREPLVILKQIMHVSLLLAACTHTINMKISQDVLEQPNTVNIPQFKTRMLIESCNRPNQISIIILRYKIVLQRATCSSLNLTTERPKHNRIHIRTYMSVKYSDAKLDYRDRLVITVLLVKKIKIKN